MLPASRQKPLKAPKETMNVIWLSLVLKLKRVTRSVPRTIISMPNIFSDRCAQPERKQLPSLTGTLEATDHDSLARIAQVLQRDFRSTANQLRQEGKVVRDKSQSCVDAAYTLDRLATTVKDVDPNLLLAYHELVTENPDRVRHAELLRQVAFTGKIKTASEYLSAYISDRTGGGRVA